MADTPTTSALQAKNVSVGYGRRQIVSGLDLAIPDASLTVLLGPNGCGKSTLLKALAGTLAPQGGTVSLDGKPISAMASKQLARRVGLLPQGQPTPDGLTVLDLVRQGRYPHRTLFGGWTSDDEEACTEALQRTGTAEFATRTLDTLSGGQRQRAWIAMALAQQTDIFLLDEPTTYLDLSHQIEVLNLLGKLVREHGATVVAVLHDINQAARYADHLVLMKDGALVTEGPVRRVLTSDLIRAVFDVEVTIIPDPRTGLPICIPADDGYVGRTDG